MSRTLAPALDDYHRAVSDLIAGAALVTDARWSVPRATGKWSPAEEIEHITLAHEVFAQQLDGAPPMQVIVTGWRRYVLRWFILPWILRTGRFPRARTPREARPSGEELSREVLTARLTAAAALVSSNLERRGGAVFRERLDHPYFGAMTLAQLLRLTTVHTRHHLATLTRASVSAP